MASEINNQIYNCINNNKSFVLQGGAGSGKTETLKEMLQLIYKEFPNKKVACITHTNIAVDEIKSRTENKFYISTIHSFLYNLISNFKINIKECYGILFELDQFVRNEISIDETELKEFNKNEYNKFKKLYEKCRTRAKNYQKISMQKCVGKKDYDKEPEKFNVDLNSKINKYNMFIKKTINENCDYKKIRYNETVFNNFKEFSFGHDGLLEIAIEMIKKYRLLVKIINDKFDIIFIDEFQDTNYDVLKVFLDKIAFINTTVGLFGDEMQAIYKDGIGSVKEYTDNRKLVLIEKPANYRCSYEVVDLIKKIRSDKVGIDQEVVLKQNEKESDRHGSVKLYYSIVDKKPVIKSDKNEKEEYFNKLDFMINQVTTKNENEKTKFTKLLLSNSAVAKKLGFNNLFSIFHERYGQDLKDQLEKDCTNLMWLEIAELCNNYRNYDKLISSNHTAVVEQLKKYCYHIETFSKKKELCDILNKLCESDESICKVTDIAIKYKLINESDARKNYLNTAKDFLKDLKDDLEFSTFEKDFYDDKNTLKKMTDAGIEIDDDLFKELKSKLLRKNFYIRLLSNEIKFKELLIFCNYLNENTDYMTMHKTKGTGKENVLVVADEYFWTNEYDFNSLIMNVEDSKQYLATKKLFYVACSRAIKNLVIIRIIEKEELNDILKIFDDNEEIKINV